MKADFTNKFRKDYKRMMKRGFDMSRIDAVVDILVQGKSLPDKYKNHFLVGNYKGCQDCHIMPDWLLIYRIEENVIFFIRTGSHSDLF